MVGTIALIVVLSAFNGIENLVNGFYTTFDPDLKVELKEGKYFELDSVKENKIKNLSEVAAASKVLEERVLLTYKDQEYIATLKGVDDRFPNVTQIKNAVTHGKYFQDPGQPQPTALLGAGVAYFLSYSRLNFTDPINVFVPRSNTNVANFNSSFSSDLVYPTGIFSVQPEFDEKYLLASLDFARKLIEQPKGLTSFDIHLKQGADLEKAKAAISKIMGNDFAVKDRNEQQAVFIKVMKSESLFTFLVFALILAIASFTIMGSLSMMMLDKKDHLKTLFALGTELKTLRSIFFKEGLIISSTGALIGLIIAVILVLLQQFYGIINLGQGYVVNSYPVELRWRDVGTVIITVSILCGLSSWLTSRRLTLKFLK